MNRQYHYQLGQQVSYILLSSQKPMNPTREYHGIITGICPEHEQIRMKLTDPGYEGLEEWIEIEQIIAVFDEKPGSKSAEQSPTFDSA